VDSAYLVFRLPFVPAYLLTVPAFRRSFAPDYLLSLLRHLLPTAVAAVVAILNLPTAAKMRTWT
jgi:hypothetical protein